MSEEGDACEYWRRMIMIVPNKIYKIIMGRIIAYATDTTAEQVALPLVFFSIPDFK